MVLLRNTFHTRVSLASARAVDHFPYPRALRKTSYILRALSELVPKPSLVAPISYFALDLEERELKRTLSELNLSDLGPVLSGKVETQGLLGTYESGLRFIADGGLSIVEREDVNLECSVKANTRERNHSTSSSESTSTSSSTEATSLSTADQPPLHLMFLGSSIGNFATGEDAAFIRSFPLRPASGDTFLLGLSHDTKREDIELAYNDPKGHTKDFIMNGLSATGNALGDSDLFDLDNWEYVNWYNEDERSCFRRLQIGSWHPFNTPVQEFTRHTASACVLTKSNFQAPSGRSSSSKASSSILKSLRRRVNSCQLLHPTNSRRYCKLSTPRVTCSLFSPGPSYDPFNAGLIALAGTHLFFSSVHRSSSSLNRV